MLPRKWFLIFLLSCFDALPAFTQNDSCHLQISLLTCGPGEDLYSIFGHTAIRVKDSYTRTDTVYNYGTFDDSDPYFYLKFTRGIMVYSLSVEPFSYFMEEYITEHRSVAEQILQLSCADKQKLSVALQTNASERNRYYNYHFYNDNCTLRARDIIINNSNVPVSFKNILPTQNITYRNLINSYLDKSSKYWSKFGINIFLGSHLDAAMNNQQTMFLPDYLMKGFSDASIGNKALVSQTSEILSAHNTDQNNSSWFTPTFLFITLMLTTITLSFIKASWSKIILNIFDFIFFLSIGLLGIIMLYLWLGRVDTVCRNNMNLLWAFPTHAIIIFFMRRRQSWIRNYFRLTALISAILLLGWKWWPQELTYAVLPLCMLIIFRSISIAQKKIAMEKKILYHGKEIFYRVQGKGNPVILIHGFAEDGTIWEEQVNHLKNNFLLIIPDIPGSGKSGTMNLSASIEDHAIFIKAILEKEKITACIMIGHSMGGYITLAFAEKYPGLLQGLGLFHSTAYADSEEKKEMRRKSIVFIRQFGAAPFIEQSTPNLFSENFRKQHPQIITELINRYSNFDPASLISYYEAMIQRPDRTHILKTFQHPVMFIMGEEDKAIPLQHGLEQCHMPQLSFIHISENTAHMGMIEDVPSSTFVVENFIKGICNF